MRPLLFVGLLVFGASAWVAQASAGGRAVENPQWHDSKGCYAFRGRITCSRYCWRDLNGHRYCHERESLAYPHTPKALVRNGYAIRSTR